MDYAGGPRVSYQLIRLCLSFLLLVALFPESSQSPKSIERNLLSLAGKLTNHPHTIWGRLCREKSCPEGSPQGSTRHRLALRQSGSHFSDFMYATRPFTCSSVRSLEGGIVGANPTAGPPSLIALAIHSSALPARPFAKGAGDGVSAAAAGPSPLPLAPWQEAHLSS